jgi:hypothetical protein
VVADRLPSVGHATLRPAMDINLDTLDSHGDGRPIVACIDPSGRNLILTCAVLR